MIQTNVSNASIENALRELQHTGQLIKDRPYRQIWRFEFQGAAYYLKFYPRNVGRLKRLFRGNPALYEFTRLQRLQKANIPAPRAISMLAGFRIGDKLGDAVLMHAIEHGIPLDRYLNNLELSNNQPSVPLPEGLSQNPSKLNRRQIADQMTQIVQKLASARLGHRDLHLGNFLLSDDKIHLMDAYALRLGGMKISDLLLLGHSARRYATKTELLRFWRQLGGGDLPKRNNKISRRLRRKEMSRITRDNAYFGRLIFSSWSGYFFKYRKFPVRWSLISRLHITEENWQEEWPRLIRQLDSDQFRIIKQSASGQVMEGQIILGGKPLDVIIKRPRRKYIHRYFNELGRGSRSRRAWNKAWSLIIRDIPTAWPLLLMEKKRFGYVTDQLVIFEKIPGKSLGKIALKELSRLDRDRLFWRAGHLLRELERFGLYHWDAKASNFIIFPDSALGLTPLLIDVDGIRKIRWTRSSIHRLLTSMREVQADYNPSDSYALCRGYAPDAKLFREAK